MASPSLESLPPIVVVGYPGDIGGANTECWHTLRLWRRHGLRVSLLPTGKPDSTWRRRLDDLGCTTLEKDREDLEKIEELRDSIVVAFCNSGFLHLAARLQLLGCRIVWVNCMTWLSTGEIAHYRRGRTFDAYVFQSRHQRALLLPKLKRHGVRPDQCHLIHGAFCVDEFPFRPAWHDADEPLVLGRISRAAPDKFSADTWSLYARPRCAIRARVMGWDRAVQRKVGPPPDWAECLPPGSEPATRFLGTLHVMAQVNGGAGENWPRSGLEAMAVGVPVVAENRWGWPEMIRHGETGLLWNSPQELAEQIERLARNESWRLDLARNARAFLESELANSDGIGKRWQRLFLRLAKSPNRTQGEVA